MIERGIPMSVFKRAEWKSGLTYRQVCNECKTIVTYTDDILDFRPWYADGFVYCPGCNKPLRHSEHHAINGPASTPNEYGEATAQSGNSIAQFCSQCGAKFNANARFCSQCGAKR